MAQELTITASLAYAKSSISVETKPTTYRLTVNGSHAIKNTASVGTADETLAKGDIGTIGWVFVRNLDATNYVTFGADGTNQPIKCLAGEGFPFRFNGSDLHAKANTAACVVEYTIIEH